MRIKSPGFAKQWMKAQSQSVYLPVIFIALSSYVLPSYAQSDQYSKHSVAHYKAYPNAATHRATRSYKSQSRSTYQPRSQSYPNIRYYPQSQTVVYPTTRYYVQSKSVQSRYHVRAVAPAEDAHLWSLTASIGYTNFQNMYQSEGQTALGRLAFGAALLDTDFFNFGVELGVQNGNQMRLDVSEADLNALGGSPIQTTVKPTLDLLATAMSAPLLNTPLFAQIKGGIAYRRWQFDDRTSIDFLSNVAGELQAGIGIAISKTANLSVLYQGIYGGNPNFVVNTTNETGSISTVPIQNGVLLSLAVMV